MTDDPIDYLFVYGTLRDPAVQQRIIGRVVPGKPDTLLDYGKGQIELGGTYYPIILPVPGLSVDGAVLELTPDELLRTDAYEGRDYRRIRVTLQSGLTAWVYAK